LGSTGGEELSGQQHAAAEAPVKLCSRQQAAGSSSRQQQQAAGSRQQAADSSLLTPTHLQEDEAVEEGENLG
jgi:hypothetical protein